MDTLKNSLSLLFVISFLITNSLKAQNFENWGIESNLFIGKVTVHTPAILLDIDHLSQGLDLNFKYQTFGKQEWHQYQNYPDLGISMVYFNLGNPEVLGYAIGVMPNLTIDIFRKKNGYIQYQFGWGLGYVSRPYDRISNPLNNAVSSHWNNLVVSRFDGGYEFNSTWSAHLGFGITHYSNGASRLPNYGINIVSGNVGIKYTPNAVERKNYKWHDDYLNVSPKKWGTQIHFDLAYKSIGGFGGIRYPVYIGSAALTYEPNAVNRFFLGLEMEYNSSVYHYIINGTTNFDEEYAKSQSRRYMIFFADEFLFGNFGLLLQGGFYLVKKERVPSIFYNKLSMRYYFSPVGKPATKFFAAVYLKSHLSSAEYLAFGIGASF